MSKMTIKEIITRWNSGDGKPYKGKLIDYDAFERDPGNIGCMCAQGQILSGLKEWSPIDLRDSDQSEADLAVAEELNISTAHAIPRLVNVFGWYIKSR